MVKMWARNNDLISSVDNMFSFPTSYAWVLITLFFVQVRMDAIPRLFRKDGTVKDVWGCRSSTFVERSLIDFAEASSEKKRSIPASPLTAFILFLHFLAHESQDLVMDLMAQDETKSTELHVNDPVELERVVTKNVSSDSYELIKLTAKLYLDRLERVRSFGEFLDIVSTRHNEATADRMAGNPTVSDLVDL
jgi:hypothetical protein